MKENDGINFLKNVCALLIVNNHTDKLSIPFLSNVAKFGFICNTIFVFLSGYLISCSISSKTECRFKYFIYRRINRIYPSLHIALLVAAFMYLCDGILFNLSSLALTSTGFAYFLGDDITFGRHLWFVSVILVYYILFIPTYHLSVRQPVFFFILLFVIASISVFLHEKPIKVIYSELNEIHKHVLHAFVYYYIVFSIAVYLGVTGRDISFGMKKNIWYEISILCIVIYLYALYYPSYGIARIPLSLFLAICSIVIFSTMMPSKYFHFLSFISPITYEIYIIHYPVIIVINSMLHENFVAYPLVFIVSIVLAVLIKTISLRYQYITGRISAYFLRIDYNQFQRDITR